MLAILAACIGLSVWLDVAAPIATGRIRQKNEEIAVTNDGEWTRAWRLDVAFPPSHSGLRPNVVVDSAQFARLRVGDPVRLRYFACCPIFARYTERSTLDWTRQLARDGAYVGRWGLWLVAGVIGMIVTSKRSRVAVLIVGAVWAAGAVAVDAFSPRPAPAPQGPTALARVRDVRSIDWLLRPGRRSYGWRYTVPFDVATLAFVPGGQRDTVVAVDMVDHGSVAGLSPDSLRVVRYDTGRPREAQLTAGTRTFPARNRPDGVIVVAIVVVFLVGGSLLVAGSRARRPGRA